MASYSNEQLTEIKKLSALFFSPKEIAVMMEWSEDEFLKDVQKENSPCYNAFNAGCLQTEVDLRTAIIKLAKAGSSPAQTMSMDLLKQFKMKLKD